MAIPEFAPLRHFFAFFRAHTPGDNDAAFLSPEEPVALFVACQSTRFAQPGFFILPPVAETLLPDQTGVIHIAIQRFGKRTVNVQRARMKHGERIVDGRHQPARRNILRGTRQRQSLGGCEANIPA